MFPERMTEKDRIDMEFVLEEGVDFIALSFVQTAQDVIDAREIIGDKAGIIVKIEKPSAVEQLDEILAVIVATHMLESMIDSPTPTRAEASDVATAIYQGADAVMLSAETAVGRHPATAVAIMDRIITMVESDPEYWSGLGNTQLPQNPTTEDAISQSIRTIVETLDCSGVLGYTQTGSTVRRMSRERPRSKIVGLTPNRATASRLALSWGVQAIVTEDPSGFNDMILRAEQVAISVLGKKSGDQVLIAAGIPFGRPGRTDTLKIATICRF